MPSHEDVPLPSGGNDSVAGPGSPCRGLEWVVIPAAPRDVRHPPLRARSGTLYPPWCLLEQVPVWANRGEI